ncbi:MAG: polysaccharide deacetylase [Hyphomicrobiales bacterium]|nr:polysaccharide deacetylase [Hyphomicrobiales bacterium]
MSERMHSIRLLCPAGRLDAADIVLAAVRRSCGRGAVVRASYAELLRFAAAKAPGVWVVIDPPDAWAGAIAALLEQSRSKILLLGRVPALLLASLGMHEAGDLATMHGAADCGPAPVGGSSESAAVVRWTRAVGRGPLALSSRPFRRFDFADEWNNLGYGAIALDGSIWSLSQLATAPGDAALAHVGVGGKPVATWSALIDRPGGSLLWINRPVGPVDSPDWSEVERFLSDHRPAHLPCVPVFSEVPAGHSAAVTMRLDCDEDVESARELAEAYARIGIPFSLALLAKVLGDARHHDLPRQLLRTGGSVLSHSVTHAERWGGDYEAAMNEAIHSAATIEQVTGQRVRYAVSPFHQTPAFARRALEDAGYEGVVGGIIRNDPDHLMARSGSCPASGEGFISFSQQCMLHGDCLREGSDPLRIYREAFDAARASTTFFGYLDHPFSERYRYGWRDEDQRRDAHLSLVAHMQQSGRVLFCNEEDAFDFLYDRSMMAAMPVKHGFHVDYAPLRKGRWDVGVRFRGETLTVPPDGLLL